ncbi:hypothetical protein EAKF1_ch3498c [Escherichia albertii KF1]|nr:hypothetical protein EAKF1_ch3498c [Escherichia albertii KF1]
MGRLGLLPVSSDSVQYCRTLIMFSPAQNGVVYVSALPR